jgi:hypothetical protein
LLIARDSQEEARLVPGTVGKAYVIQTAIRRVRSGKREAAQ